MDTVNIFIKIYGGHDDVIENDQQNIFLGVTTAVDSVQ